MKKNLVALLLAGAMAMASLTGCAGGELDNSEVAVTVDGDEITADIANFYARYTQAQYELYYGASYGQDTANMWGNASDDSAFQASVKTSVAEELAGMYIKEDHMEEYGVEITAEDEAAITEAAAAFMEANSEEALAQISATQDTVERVMRLFMIQTKVADAIYETADLEVSDEEAAQMKMEYVVFPFDTTDDEGTTRNLTDDEMAALKLRVEAFAEGAKDAEDFEAYAAESEYEALETTFDAEETQIIPVELAKAAAALEVGGTTGLVEGPNGYYVARLVSDFDEEATETEKEAIRSERKSAKLEEVEAEWREAAAVTIYNKVWKKIDFDKVGVSMKVAE